MTINLMPLSTFGQSCQHAAAIVAFGRRYYAVNDTLISQLPKSKQPGHKSQLSRLSVTIFSHRDIQAADEKMTDLGGQAPSQCYQ